MMATHEGNPMNDVNALRQRVRSFRQAGGQWSDAFDPLVERAPTFIEAYIAYAERPLVAKALQPKVRELVSLALNAAATHLYAPRMRTHIAGALDAGASEEEIVEVLQLVSVIGVHASVLGIPILVRKLRDAPQGKGLDLSNTDARRAVIKADFQARRGYWNDIWDGLLALDPDFFQAFADYSAAPWTGGCLAPKVKEFVYIAMDISSTHQFEPGTHIHIENALKHGASTAELVEVIQLSSFLGMESFEVGLPILAEELARRAKRRAAE